MDVKVFGFIYRDIKSKASREAFQIYAEELTGITGMVAVQYFSYEQAGEILWFKNLQGIEIPISAATYSCGIKCTLSCIIVELPNIYRH